ncbi:uncharacterized protein [Drosophila kikkawai]|uniref:Uncharacterized protein n=1 Tax=Drosophila kikkawai TaxID=30033 RepID=A0ABM4GP06_DROKI
MHRCPGLPITARHRQLVRDQLSALPAQLPRGGLPLPARVRGHWRAGGTGGCRYLLHGPVPQLRVRMPTRQVSLLLVRTRIAYNSCAAHPLPNNTTTIPCPPKDNENHDIVCLLPSKVQ